MENQPEKPGTIWQTILKWIWKIVPFAVVLLFIGIVIFPMGKKIAAKKAMLEQQQAGVQSRIKPLANVVTLEMIPGPIKETLTLPGMARPWVLLDVVAEVKGRVVRKRTRQGRQVKKGDILVVIDKKDYQIALDAAQASYDSAVTSQKRLKVLSQKKFAAKSNLDDANALVKTTKSALDNAWLNLDRCKITTPMKGVVNQVYIENGQYVNPGDPIAQVLQMDQLKIEVGIPESDVDAVRRLKTFKVIIDALEGETITGAYHYLHKTTSSLARLYTLEIKVDNPDGRILSDMFAKVEIIKHQDPQGLAVPLYTLVHKNDKEGVYVEENGTVRFQPVTKGFHTGWLVQVVAGLSPGDQVVVVGHRIIEQGQQVNVTQQIKDIREVSQ